MVLAGGVDTTSRSAPLSATPFPLRDAARSHVSGTRVHRWDRTTMCGGRSAQCRDVPGPSRAAFPSWNLPQPSSTAQADSESLRVMISSRDWAAWHEPYLEPGSDLSQRLRLVQGEIASWLDRRPDGELSVVSACAGQGHDLLGVLAQRGDRDRVQATLIEMDARNVEAARAAARRLGLDRVTVEQGDAGVGSSYDGAVPADLLLLAGVFGNVSDTDVRRTVRALPHLCREGATVIWTRTRRAPDLTGAIRGWFRAAGFAEEAFHAPEHVLFSVGVHRLEAPPKPHVSPLQLFEFV